jgi:hypothetical protein
MKRREQFQRLVAAVAHAAFSASAGRAPDSDSISRRILRAKIVKLATSGAACVAARRIPPRQDAAAPAPAPRSSVRRTCETASTKAHPIRGPRPRALHAPRRSTRRSRLPSRRMQFANTRGTGAPCAKQMGQEAMFLEQSFSIAHRAMMALDEDTRPPRVRHHAAAENGAGSRQNLDRLAAGGKLAQQRAHFGQRQRRPVGFHQRAVHSVRFHCCAHRNHPPLEAATHEQC